MAVGVGDIAAALVSCQEARLAGHVKCERLWIESAARWAAVGAAGVRAEDELGREAEGCERGRLVESKVPQVDRTYAGVVCGMVVGRGCEEGFVEVAAVVRGKPVSGADRRVCRGGRALEDLLRLDVGLQQDLVAVGRPCGGRVRHGSRRLA